MTVHISHLTVHRDDSLILNDISFHAHQGEVVGVIGDNGAGKTTLLDAIEGRITLTAGHVHASSIARLEQDMLSGHSIEAYYPQLEPWQLHYAISLAEITASPDTRLDTLSGGQRTRLGLAAILVIQPQPDVLLLDEPTNNLDAEGIMWLKQIIRQFRGTVLLVSHDRSLLDAVCTHIIELRHQKATLYTGNYSAYVSARDRERQQQLDQYDHYQEQKKSLERQIHAQHRHIRKPSKKPTKDNDKFLRNAQKDAAQASAGSKLRALKSKLAQLDETERPEKIVTYRSHLHGTVPPHKLIVEIQDVTHAYGQHTALRPTSHTVRGAERLHVLGRNGSGKSTFLKLLGGRLQLQAGTITYGENVKVGYFSQDADQLQPDLPLAGQIQTKTKNEETALYENARALGLPPLLLQKPIATFSRGQRAKAAFLELLMNDYQLLILDEPTNHLDIHTRELIEDALHRYEGAIVFASHDTYFADKLATATLNLANN